MDFPAGIVKSFQVVLKENTQFNAWIKAQLLELIKIAVVTAPMAIVGIDVR